MPLASGQCDCGKELDSDEYHLITCKTGGSPVIRHNNMVLAWSDCLSQLQLHHVKEPRGRYVNSEDRSDIVVFDSASGMDLELDIALAHPWSNEIEGLSATTQRAAATRRENLKIKKVRPGTLTWRFSTNVCAYSLRTFWLLGRES